MNEKRMRISRTAALSGAIFAWLTISGGAVGATASVTTGNVHVRANAVQENAKNDSQSISVITKADINEVRAKSAEDVVFRQTGVLRTVDAMGNVGVSIRGAEPRHTLIVVDGQPVMGYLSKYRGAGDALLRMGTENIDHMEIVRGASSAKYGADAIGGVIDVHTKQPSSKAGAELGMEFRYRNDFRGTSLPMNYYFRGDTGRVGKLKVAVTASKRDIDPINSQDRVYTKGVNWYNDFQPSLRYYGEIKNAGIQGEYAINNRQKLSFQTRTEREHLERRNKSVDPRAALGSFLEPMQIFKRVRQGDTNRIVWEGRNSRTDWRLQTSYGKVKEQDITLLTYYDKGSDAYGGCNDLGGVDWLKQNRWAVDVTANTALNDRHILSYGLGYSRETGEGSRLKRAPHTRVETIDPWDYDKSLLVEDKTAGKDDVPHTHVHEFDLQYARDGGVIWNKNREFYGVNTAQEVPPMTKEEWDDAQNVYNEYYGAPMTYQGPPELEKKYNEALQKIGEPSSTQADMDEYNKLCEEYNSYMKPDVSPELEEKNKQYHQKQIQFQNILAQQNPQAIGTKPEQVSSPMYLIPAYYSGNKLVKYNGKYYEENFNNRQNKLVIGNATIRKQYAYLQDTWQISDRLRVSPILRLDHSNLFGNHVTFNLGGVYAIGNKRRLKMNVGTGYAEPGLAELYYSWQMFGGAGEAHPGWYWLGNPQLQPEKSFNVDVSLEGENKNTYARIGIFHNHIRDYLAPYFTGQYIDFDFIAPADSHPISIDRIYRFRNIGSADITGVEAEVRHQFTPAWSIKAGYTYLHAVNNSESDLPKRLPDRPVHKVDLAVTYNNRKKGIRATVWSDYYIRMLDSNSGYVQDPYKKDKNGNYIKQPAKYKEKTFGLWHMLVEKQVNKDTAVYLGIDNLFNHHDDERAYQERSYRLGMHMKLADIAAPFTDGAQSWGQWSGEPQPFISRYAFASSAPRHLSLWGEYDVRSESFTGENKANMRLTKETAATADAARNNADASFHGSRQRLRLGLAYALTKHVEVKAVGRMGAEDTSREAGSRGLTPARLETAEVNIKHPAWDYTIGRIHEKMGVTGYWFNKEYDGVRLVYTDAAHGWQTRLGYGDFSHTTGHVDSAYNHKEQTIIHRAPTRNELFGMYGFNGDHYYGAYIMPYNPQGKYNYREKFNHAGEIQNEKGEWIRDPKLSDVEIARRKLKVAQEWLQIVKNVDYPDAAQQKLEAKIKGIPYQSVYEENAKKFDGVIDPINNDQYEIWLDAQVRLPDGTIEDWLASEDGNIRHYLRTHSAWGREHYGNAVVKDPVPHFSGYGKLLTVSGKKFTFGEIFEEKNIRAKISSIYDAMTDYYTNKRKTAFSFVDPRTGKVLSKEQQLDKLFVGYVGYHAFVRDTTPAYSSAYAQDQFLQAVPMGTIARLFHEFLAKGYDPTLLAPIPLSGAPKTMTQQGYLLAQDKIPAMERAGYIQLKKQVTPTVGLEVWHVRSLGDKKAIHGTDMKVANVVAAGIQAKVGKYAQLSAEYGVNFSSLGKYFHGGHMYGVPTDTGTAPAFGVVRLDIGRADTERRGSWQAYLDYKAFAHGAFFGGTGADVPDRYLDGIRSFTFGFSYVPRKKMLLQGFYTFGAKGLQKRDTLYTPENFSLGDYVRLQATYRF